MFNTGKCPKCDKTLTSIAVEDIDLSVDYAPRWRGFSYTCPHCRAVIGTQMNPLTLNSDLRTEIISEFRKQISDLREEIISELRK